MKFKVASSFAPYSFGSQLWEVIRAIFTFLIIPFTKLSKSEKQKKHSTPNEWVALDDSQEIKVMELDSDTSADLVSSAEFDFPQLEDWGDPFRAQIRLKSKKKNTLEGLLFDDMIHENKHGWWIIRINPKGKGMTLCLISAETLDLQEILELNAYSWKITEPTSNIINISADAYDGKHSHQLTIEETW